jgi:peptidoglycan/xylan/chitin deacetylase (PgdA/CDA1 family)
MRSPTPIQRHLNELGLRSRLRCSPRLQGRILAAAGARKRLPAGARLFFPFYHDVPPEFAAGLRRQLRVFGELGSLVSWDAALQMLTGHRALNGPAFCLSFDDGHPTWRDVVVPLLAELGVPATFFVTTGLIGRPDNLSWNDVRDLLAAGHGIGSHSVTHPRFADCDEASARREIVASKHELEDELGVAVRDFAAPYGNPVVDLRDRRVRAARQAGYRSFATTLRPAMRAGDSPMWIHRQRLHPAWPLWAVRTRVHD